VAAIYSQIATIHYEMAAVNDGSMASFYHCMARHEGSMPSNHHGNLAEVGRLIEKF
jgi:hypothetical protein